MKTWSLPVLVLTLTLASPAAGDLESERAKYRPYPHRFPQVIQEFDYDTIKFIESLYAAVHKLGTAGISCAVGKGAVTFKSAKNGAQRVSLKQIAQGTIDFNGRLIETKNTVQLTTSLIAILSDLSAGGPCKGIGLVQFGTRTYKRRTILEFNFGSRVVVVESASNRPGSDERIYILDLIEPSESFFFAKTPTGADR
jgi:hypothetical protein